MIETGKKPSNIEKCKMYKGKIMLVFDPGKHFYKANNEIIPGVTSITGIINKPALLYWAVKCSGEMFKRLIKPGKKYSEVDIDQFSGEIRDAHIDKSGRAKAIGTLAHEHIDAIIHAILDKKKPPKKPFDTELLSCRNAFAKWYKDNKVKFLASERKVLSLKHKYAGTLDILATVNGKLTVIDLKTSSGIYPEYLYQVSGYAKAYEEESGKKVDQVCILRIGKINAEMELVEIDDVDRYFKIFLACKTVYEEQLRSKGEKIEKIKLDKITGK